MATLKAVFGNNLRQCRKAKGWSQAQLAEAADLSLDMVGRLERGAAAPSFDTIEDLARAMGVPAATLFGSGSLKLPRNTARAAIMQKIEQRLADTNDQQLKTLAKVIAAVLDE